MVMSSRAAQGAKLSQARGHPPSFLIARPKGYVLIRVFVGRAGQNIPWNENKLFELAKEEVKLTSDITAEPIVSRVFMWEKAMPQYNLGHLEILQHMDAALENYPNLALAGAGYREIGIPDCIHSGELAVEKILNAKDTKKHKGFSFVPSCLPR